MSSADSTTNEPVTLEGAVIKALEYEYRVRDLYVSAAEESGETGKRIFQVLADEEQGHVDFLERQLELLRSSGSLSDADISSSLPSKERIEKELANVREHLSADKPQPNEIELLQKALKAEEETSAFYRKVVDELPEAGRKLFVPFLAIEDGHVAIVQAEIDAVSGTGFWFDIQEFSLEAG